MVWKVSGVTNSCAPSVIITNASAPFFFNWLTTSTALYAAIPPVTPTIIFLSFNISILHPVLAYLILDLVRL